LLDNRGELRCAFRHEGQVFRAIDLSKGVLMSRQLWLLFSIAGLLWQRQVAGGNPQPETVLPPGAVSRLKLGPGQCHDVAYSADGKLVATAGSDGTVRLWEPQTGKLLRALSDHGQEVHIIRFAPARDRGPGAPLLLASASGQTIRLWDATTGRLVRSFPTEGQVTCLTFTEDGKRLFTGPQLSSWDVESGRRLPVPQLSARVSDIALAPDGHGLAVLCDRDGRVQRHNNGRLAEVHSGLVYNLLNRSRLGWAPDGDTMFWMEASGDGLAVVFWDPVVQKERRRIRYGNGIEPTPGRGSREHFTRFVLSPDGLLLATPGPDDKARVWDVASGQLVLTLSGHSASVWALAFAPDGRTLVSVSEDSTALIWDLTLRTWDLPEGKQLSKEADLKRHWDALAGADGKQAFRAGRILAAQPNATVGLLDHQFPSGRLDTPPRIQSLLKDLDHDQFKVREAAREELSKLGRQAAPALRETLKQSPSPEVRHSVLLLLDQIQNLPPGLFPEVLQRLRAVTVLELIGTPEAHLVLKKLAGSEPVSPWSRAARLALARLENRG
jgi:WD40 repeat protein